MFCKSPPPHDTIIFFYGVFRNTACHCVVDQVSGVDRDPDVNGRNDGGHSDADLRPAHLVNLGVCVTHVCDGIGVIGNSTQRIIRRLFYQIMNHSDVKYMVFPLSYGM